MTRIAIIQGHPTPGRALLPRTASLRSKPLPQTSCPPRPCRSSSCFAQKPIGTAPRLHPSSHRLSRRWPGPSISSSSIRCGLEACPPFSKVSWSRLSRPRLHDGRRRGRQPLEDGAQGQIRAHCRHNGHASLRLPSGTSEHTASRVSSAASCAWLASARTTIRSSA